MGVYDYLRVEMELPNVAYGRHVPEELVVNTNSLFQTKSLDKDLKHYLLDKDGVLRTNGEPVKFSGVLKFYTFDRFNYGVSEATILGHWYEFRATLKKGVVQDCELIQKEALSRERV
mgnify:CR=1 FL=1